VIGVSVIVACRLERLTCQFPDTPILISQTPWRSTACWDCADRTQPWRPCSIGLAPAWNLRNPDDSGRHRLPFLCRH